MGNDKLLFTSPTGVDLLTKVGLWAYALFGLVLSGLVIGFIATNPLTGVPMLLFVLVTGGSWYWITKRLEYRITKTEVLVVIGSMPLLSIQHREIVKVSKSRGFGRVWGCSGDLVCIKTKDKEFNLSPLYRDQFIYLLSNQLQSVT